MCTCRLSVAVLAGPLWSAPPLHRHGPEPAHERQGDCLPQHVGATLHVAKGANMITTDLFEARRSMAVNRECVTELVWLAARGAPRRPGPRLSREFAQRDPQLHGCMLSGSKHGSGRVGVRYL